MKYFSLTPPRAQLPLLPATLLLLMCGAYSNPAKAQDKPWGGYVTATSDYVYRGMSQTDGGHALQAEANYQWDSITVSLWGSNVDLGGPSDAHLELDVGLAWSHSLSDKIDLNFGFLRYVYPGEHSNDYSEFFVGFDVGNMSAGFYVAPEYFGTQIEATYFDLSYTLPIEQGIGLTLHAGRNLFSGVHLGEESPAYWDFSLSFDWSFEDWGVTVAYVQTDLERDPTNADRIVGSVTRSF